MLQKILEDVVSLCAYTENCTDTCLLEDLELVTSQTLYGCGNGFEGPL